jgi:hypothetical protein
METDIFTRLFACGRSGPSAVVVELAHIGHRPWLRVRKCCRIKSQMSVSVLGLVRYKVGLTYFSRVLFWHALCGVRGVSAGSLPMGTEVKI